MTESRSRWSRRGAALVEASLVMPVIVIFYGLMVFVFHEYDLKGSLMATTRLQAFQTALHQCKGSDDIAPTAAGFTRVDAFEGATRAQYVSAILDGAGARAYVATGGMKATATTHGVASNSPLSQVVRERDISSESEVFCVPRSMGGAGNAFVAPARRQAVALVDRVLGPILSALRVLFNEKL
jgi:hypothetical protein